MILGKEKSTRGLILEVVISESPLTLNKIYHRIRKKYGINITYQAIHKLMNELVTERVLLKDKKEYKINFRWVRNLESFCVRLKKAVKRERKPHIEVGSGTSVEKEPFLAGKEAAEKAVSEIRYYGKYSLALAFISSEYEGKFGEILDGVYSVIGDTQLIGITTAGEIMDKRLRGSVVISVIASTKFKVDISVIVDTNKYIDNYDKAGEDLLKGNKLSNPNFGIIFFPGLSSSNEMISSAPFILESLKNFLPKNLPLIGAQAGDDWMFKVTYQFYNKKVFTNAVILALVKTRLKFGINGLSVYKSINNKTYRIKVKDNCITEMAYNRKKLDYKPALDFYTKEIGISVRELRDALPNYIKEKISENTIDPIADITDPNIVSHPVGVKKNGIVFKYNFDNNAIIEIRKTYPELLVKTLNKVIDKTIISENIKKPALILILPCCIFEAILSKSNIREIELLKEECGLAKCNLLGAYVYGEIGYYNNQTKSASGTVVSLVVGDELK